MVPRPICYKCNHVKLKNGIHDGCKAYPKGINKDIIEGEPHDKVRKDQVGKFVFEHKGGD